MLRKIITSVIMLWALSGINAQNPSKSGPCPGMSQFTDPRDGKTYNTVQIGDRCWMKENLNVGAFINSSINQTNNATLEKYCYDNIEENCNIYGGLYLWDEMMQYATMPGIQGICADGWRIPTDAEWCAMTSSLDATVNCNLIGNNGTNAGGLLKETGITHWSSPNTGATNGSEFTGLPGGWFTTTDNSFTSKGCYGFFHTSSANGTGRWAWLLGFEEASVSRVSYVPGAYSVRCIRDANWTAQLTVTPPNQDVMADAGTTTFNVTSNTSWTVTETETWLSVSPMNGSNNGTLTVTYDANALPDPRVGQIIVTAGGGNPVVNVTVTQVGLPQQWTCGQNITDIRDGKSYTTVQIGTQCWMAQNLNIGTRIAGTSNQTNNATIEKYCYSNLETNCDIYGGLYQWDETMQYSTTTGVQGICPAGLHLPTDAEWTTLTTYVSSQPAYLCNNNTTNIAKSLAATTNWTTYTDICTIGNNLAANNATGFTALPGGYRGADGSFGGVSYGGYWWSSSESSATYAWGRYMGYGGANVNRNYAKESNGFSVRCLKD